jgi:hypothetical protein
MVVIAHFDQLFLPLDDLSFLAGIEKGARVRVGNPRPQRMRLRAGLFSWQRLL